MKFPRELVPAIIIKRYKRFLVDLKLESGEEITAHIANTGSMKTCWAPGWKALLLKHDDPKRKYKYSVELINNGKSWINVNTHSTNKIVKEAVEKGVVKEFAGDYQIKSEYKVGESRFDFFLQGEEKIFVEVKNVTLLSENGMIIFPDAVSIRGQKHLKELIRLKKEGYRAAMLYVVSREDGDGFDVAREIDPKYGELFDEAKASGVEILVYRCVVNPKEVRVNHSM